MTCDSSLSQSGQTCGTIAYGIRAPSRTGRCTDRPWSLPRRSGGRGRTRGGGPDPARAGRTEGLPRRRLHLAPVLWVAELEPAVDAFVPSQAERLPVV